MPQGLALYESLVRHSSAPFMLHVLAMDRECEQTLKALALPSLEVTALDVFEYHSGIGALNLRQQRTWQEYCWTCASNFAADLTRFTIEEITYLDADLMMFSDPEMVFMEMGNRSIGITPHRLIPSKKHLEVNGRYNVGWVTFRGNAGRRCLTDWASDVRNKCSATDGCGDQKYLDEWPEKYGAEVCELGIGVNVAPWNLANWRLTAGPRVDGVNVICFHAHEYLHGQRLTNYELRNEDRALIYVPYINAVNRAIERIAEVSMEKQWETA